MPVIAVGADKVSVTVNAQNLWTAALPICGKFDMSIKGGTFVATIMVQRSFDGGTTWLDFYSKADADEEKVLEASDRYPDVIYRIGCKTGGYTSGTIVCSLYKRIN